MHITKATIRTSDKYTFIDAVVDGELRKGFVLYDGTTVEHEQAAEDYLIRCGISFSDIEYDQYDYENDDAFTLNDSNIDYGEFERTEPHITF